MAATDLPALRRWLSDHSVINGLSIEPRATLELHDTYLDTDDWRIHRAGFALRVRSESGNLQVTLKALRSAQTGVANRRELTEALPGGKHEKILESPGPVGTRVLAVVGEHSLHELFEIHTMRQRFAVLGKDQTSELGEIALDETTILRPHGEAQTSVNRVEVEALTAAAPKPLEHLANTLRTQCALTPVAESKYSLGLKALGLAPPAVPTLAPVNVDASMRMEDVALANLRRNLSTWLAHEPGARLGDDPEQLHDLRVTTRRIDATLKMLRQYLPAPLVRTRATLRKLLEIFGTVRDLDVQLGQFEAFAIELPASERAAFEPLGRHLHSERDQARTQMLHALNSPETIRCIDTLRRTLADPATSLNHGNDAAAVAIAPQLIRQRYRKVRNAAKRLTAHSSLDEYHSVRRRGKKLRYAIESVAAIYGKPADEALRALRRLQDEFGAQQDAHVAQNRLLVLANDPPEAFTPQTVFIMGRLAERHRKSAARARKRAGKALGKVSGRRWKRLRARLDELDVRPHEKRADERLAAEPAARELTKETAVGSTSANLIKH